MYTKWLQPDETQACRRCADPKRHSQNKVSEDDVKDEAEQQLLEQRVTLEYLVNIDYKVTAVTKLGPSHQLTHAGAEALVTFEQRANKNKSQNATSKSKPQSFSKI